jgi:pimeloyl-ACP methyl ester carboxylesterase
MIFASCVTASLAAVHPASAQYSTYNGTYFVPGLNETSDVWTNQNTPTRLSSRVSLGAVRVPNLTNYREIDFQTQELANAVRGEPGGYTFYMIGHSMGGVTSRNLLLSPNPGINTASRIAGIVTVASPNRGAPVAEKAQQYDPRSTLGLIEGLIYTIKTGVLNLAFGALDAIASWYIRHQLDEGLFDKLNATAQGLKLPGAIDLKPSSPNIQRLGNASDAVPHAAVWGSVPQQYAWARLAASREFDSPEDKVHSVKRSRTIFRVCKAIFYNIIIKTGTGRVCASGDRAIGGFDEKWKEWTHFSNNQNSPTDGLLPEESLRYPFEGDPARQLRANGNEDHFSIVWRTPGVNRIGDGMFAARMRPASAPPPPPDPEDPPTGGCADPRQIICDP